MAKSDDAEIAIDAETKQMLEEQVNKGKARKFILIYRGATIKKLIVFRKGPFGTRIQRAKKEGFKGEAVCGIVRGTGKNITFQMAGSAAVAGAMDVDGVVDKEPTKTEKLKQFLKENQLQRKPEYKILRDVAEVAALDDAGAAGAQAAPTKAASSSSVADKSPSPSDGDAATKAKIDRLKQAVLPKVKNAVANDPSKSELIKELVKAVSDAEKARSFGDSLRALERLAITVKESIAGGGAKTDYEAALPGAEQQLRTLKSHSHHAAIAAEIRDMESALAKAKQHAGKNDFREAMDELGKVEVAFEPALRLADRSQAFREAQQELQKKYDDLKLHQGFGGIEEAKLNELRQKFADLEAKIVARDFGDARTITRDINAKLKAYRTQAHKHGDYVGLRNNALLLIEALRKHPANDKITAKITDLQTKYVDKAATEYETNGSYSKAKRLLESVSGKYDAAKAIADKQSKEQYDKVRKPIKQKIDKLDVEANRPLVGEEISAIKAQFDKAEKYAGANQFADAEKLMAELDAKCTAAESEAKRQREYATAQTAAAESAKGIQDNPQAAVDAVQSLHDQLKAHPQHAVVEADLAQVQTKIDSAAELISA